MMWGCKQCLLSIAISLVAMASGCAAAPVTMSGDDPRSPLYLTRTIALPDVKGRIDHLAIDLARRHLFVAEYGNGSVDEVDLASGRVVGRIGGLHESQGVAWLSAQHELVVTSGDGSVRFYAGADRREVARIDLGEDADNVRIDVRNGHVIVGYGGGGLATIDPASHRLLSRLLLPGHPEGFRLVGARAYVNVPDRGSIVAVDLDRGQILAIWGTGVHHMNFPMAVTAAGDRIVVAYRLPAAISALDAATGQVALTRSSCGDADDLFLDSGRVIVVCGAGYVDVSGMAKDDAVLRIITAPGARTGLLVSELDTLFVAAPARRDPAAVWVFNLRGLAR
jgi:hypothetical protein